LNTTNTPDLDSSSALVWHGLSVRPRAAARAAKNRQGKQMRGGLDAVDLLILGALQEDASHTAAQIANSMGLSLSLCWRRIQRLKQQGYIAKIVAVLDRRKLHLGTQVFVQVKVHRNDQANLTEFSEAIRKLPEIVECYVVLGAYDFLLRTIVQDMQAYEKFFFEKLSRVPNIRELNSFAAASEIKSTTALPLGL
jgi:Lrp/AsnC family transcriptional regulator